MCSAAVVVIGRCSPNASRNTCPDQVGGTGSKRATRALDRPLGKPMQMSTLRLLASNFGRGALDLIASAGLRSLRISLLGQWYWR